MIVAATKVLVIDPTTNGVSFPALRAGSLAKPLPADHIDPSGKITAAVTPGMPRDVRCWFRAAFSRGPACPDSLPVLASVPGGGNAGSAEAVTTVGAELGMAVGGGKGATVGDVAGVDVGAGVGVGVGVGAGVAIDGAGVGAGVAIDGAGVSITVGGGVGATAPEVGGTAGCPVQAVTKATMRIAARRRGERRKKVSDSVNSHALQNLAWSGSATAPRYTD
jgi:hypothetical protein